MMLIGFAGIGFTTYTDKKGGRGCRLIKDSSGTGGEEKVMEWLSQETSIAGYQIPNWAIVLVVVIVLLLIYYLTVGQRYGS